MKRNILTKAVALMLVLALVLSGCGGKKTVDADKTKPEQPEQEAEAEEPEEDTSSEEDEIPPEQMDIIKYNYYVTLNNELVEVMDSLEYYFEVVDYTEEFSLLPDTGLTYGYRVSGQNTDTLETCVMLADMDPDYGEMDDLVLEMAEPLYTVMETLSDISGSYDYADNQYQKAKEYHAVIYENAATIMDLGGQFLDAIAVMGEAQFEEEEAKMKEEGRLIIYNSSRAITISGQILKEIDAQGVTDENINDMDLTEIRKLYDELVTVVADYNTAVADNDQLIKESLSNSAPFDGLLDGLVSALEWMMKQVESGQPVDMSGSGAPLGSIGHFSYVRGQCIERYNSVFVE